MSTKTRFAPSPTGYLHIGGARTALYCWLHARKTGGSYVVRIEDTDRERSTDAAVTAIFESLKWLGLESEEKPVFQTSRMARYGEVIEALLSSGHAYHCNCSSERLDEVRQKQSELGLKPKYDGRCRDAGLSAEEAQVVRFKMPLDGVVSFDDLVRGTISFDNNELDDFVIRRSDQTPTYNLAVVVDDSDLDITHVVRGDDHINNTPKQIHLYQALNADLPYFAHVPMILGEDGKRLSKRHGAVGVMEYRNAGILPEALLNYLLRLGWSHGDQEIFSRDDMVELFAIEDVNRSPSIFNPEKLAWVNQKHMMESDPATLAALLAEVLAERRLDASLCDNLELVATVFRERAQTVVEMVDASQYLFVETVELDAAAAKKHLRPVALEPIELLFEKLNAVESWTESELDGCIDEVLEATGLKLPKLAQPLRVAVTGAASSPSIGLTLHLVGRARSLHRISAALDYINARIAAA